MIYQKLYQKYKKKDSVACGLIGSGNYGTEVVAQSFKQPLLKIPVIADTDTEAARRAYNLSGVPDENIVQCDTLVSATRAVEAGKFVITEDAMLLMQMPLDVIVESTGLPEPGAKFAYETIKNGKHLVMVNKETESVIGPMLKYLADKAGVVYTSVDGDQHGLLMGMLDWAGNLGFEIICGGKFRDFEFNYDRESREVFLHNIVSKTLSKNDAWAMDHIPDGKVDLYLKKRKELLSMHHHAKIGAWDVCELMIAANSTELRPENPVLHHPFVRFTDIPSVFCLKEDGGILEKEGILDCVTIIREKGEIIGGGGVFIVVKCGNDFAGKSLAEYNISNKKRTATMFFRPYHLTGIETLTSILCAGLIEIPTGSMTVLPRYDIVTKAAVDLKAGYIVEDQFTQKHDTLAVPATVETKDAPIPAHMAEYNKLKIDIPVGTVITYDMIEEPADSLLWSLRRQQDELFLTKK